MNAYVEECRREWERLGVPDLLAEEMATELESDIAEAEADGVSAAEMLGESDPRRFAAMWASERGLVSEGPSQQKRRKRFWITLAAGLVLFGCLLGVGGVAIFAKPTARTSREQPVKAFPPPRLVRVPALVGLKLCHAYWIAAARDFNLGFHMGRKARSRCRGSMVVHQRPRANALVPRHWAMTLRAREAPVRVPNLVGRSECTAENVLAPLDLHVRHFASDTLPCRHRRIVGQNPKAGALLQPPHAVTVRLRSTKT